jgi:hypothetical protein
MVRARSSAGSGGAGFVDAAATVAVGACRLIRARGTLRAFMASEGVRPEWGDRR